MSSQLPESKQWRKAATTALFFIGLAFVVATSANADITFVTTDDGDAITFGTPAVETTAVRLNLFQSGGNIKNVILEFDLGTLNAGYIVNSATLNLVKDGNVSNLGGPVLLHVEGFVGDGDVDIADYDAPASVLLMDAEIALGLANGTPLDFSLDTVLIQTIVDSSGLLTLRLETDSFAAVDFASLETTTGFTPPSLTLGFSSVPEPSTAAVLTAMLAGMCGLRRRR